MNSCSAYLTCIKDTIMSANHYSSVFHVILLHFTKFQTKIHLFSRNDSIHGAVLILLPLFLLIYVYPLSFLHTFLFSNLQLQNILTVLEITKLTGFNGINFSKNAALIELTEPKFRKLYREFLVYC